ncbi:hypothetical protein Dimus_021403 [Dionaea muscipula]
MGRSRGKGRKLTANDQDDPASGEEEKINPVQKRRGRPQKPLRDEIDEDDKEKKLEEDDNNENKALSKATDGKKRRRNSQAKEIPNPNPNPNPENEENGGVGAAKSNITDDSTKSNGFRHTGSRRKKSKPRRAAEVGVECN